MKPRLLDLFCGAGGMARGYQMAGFYVVGVDINPQPRYAGDEFVQADAMAFPLDGFDAVHASPPCQAHTTMSNRYRGQGGVADDHPDLIALTRERLMASGAMWVIENVMGARKLMRDPIRLSGGMFGLGVERPRLFEASVGLWAPPYVRAKNPVGVYGARPDGRRLWTRSDGTEQRAARSVQEGARAMGIDWMEWRELAEAIPPAYGLHIGRQLMAHLEAK